MSQQGEKPAAHEDDWWRKLYDEAAPDTGPSSAADSLDDRFDSVSDTVSRPAGDHRDAVRETVPDTIADARMDLPHADAYRPPERNRAVVAQEVPEPAPASAPDLIPDPRSAEGPYGKRDRQPEPEPVSGRHADPERRAAPEHAPPVLGTPPVAEIPPVPETRSVPKSWPARETATAPAVPPTRKARPQPLASPVPLPPAPHPPASRTTAFPAPWEPTVGPRGPRTFAVPGPPEPAPAPDPSALHELPPDPTAATTGVRPVVGHLGDRPPTYDAEPAALPSATSENLESLVPDTVLDGARYGTYTLRAASVRGDSARFRGEPRRDGLLTARFGSGESALVLVAVAGGRRAGESAHLAAADACHWIGGAVARSHVRLSEDIRAGRRGDLKAGLHRLTDRTYGKLRARAAERGLEPVEYTASLRCLLLSADPACRTRVFFGVGSGGLFLLRDGLWQDLEPLSPEDGGGPRSGDEQEEGPEGERLTMDLQITTTPSPHPDSSAPPPAEPFRFRASAARPGDALVLCGHGLAEPMRGEPELSAELAERWGSAGPPGLPAFLADTQLRIKGYADDRTCAAVWEA